MLQISETPIHGFVAYLLAQEEQWDPRCSLADMHDYHLANYARMNPMDALVQELCWWIEAEEHPMLYSLPHRAELLDEGVRYLHWRVQEVVKPQTDIDKLNTNMEIFIDMEHYLYKVDDALCLFENGEIQYERILLHGLPAKLLTYAACTTIEQQLSCSYIIDTYEWVDTMIGWVQSTPQIMLHNLKFNIPDVYALYDTYLSDAKAVWDANNRRFYSLNQPRQRGFMGQLLKESREEIALAIQCLEPYLMPTQLQAYSRYLHDWEQYIIDRSQTKEKQPKTDLGRFLTPFGKRTPRWQITRSLQVAATHPKTPAAHLAKEVKRLQDKRILISDLHPMTEFIATINLLFGTHIKVDSFAKRML